MNVLGDAVDRSRRERLADAPAVRHPAADRAVDYRRFCTTAWKTANFLRNEGVRGGMDVAVVDDPVPEAVLTFVGAALLGARVEFVDGDANEPRALVAPVSVLGAYDPGPRTRVVAYGGEPADPSVAYFERDVWSENPTEPPDAVVPGDDLLCAGGRTYSHADALDAARTVRDSQDVDGGTAVAVRAPLAEPRTVFAGVVAPILAGGTILLPDGERVGDVAVARGSAPEVRVVEV